MGCHPDSWMFSLLCLALLWQPGAVAGAIETLLPQAKGAKGTCPAMAKGTLRGQRCTTAADTRGTLGVKRLEKDVFRCSFKRQAGAARGRGALSPNEGRQPEGRRRRVTSKGCVQPAVRLDALNPSSLAQTVHCSFRRFLLRKCFHGRIALPAQWSACRGRGPPARQGRRAGGPFWRIQSQTVAGLLIIEACCKRGRWERMCEEEAA